MNRLLLIETSATLRHAAKTQAQNAGFQVVTVANYSDGLKTFVDLKAEDKIDGVVLGWPVKTDDDADEMFTTLMEAEHQDLGVIVLSHIVETNERSWATKRSNTALVLWDEYEEFVGALQSLGCQNTPANISEILSNVQEDSIRVLFVDDSPTIRVSYRRLLKDNGYAVETASCVSEAMEKALESEYDIVITDYYMPDGTGDSLCSKLRKNPATENITSAIITGTYSDKAIISSLAAGAVECMFKNEPKELFLARLHAMSRSILALRGIKKDHQHLQGILTTVGEGVYGVTCDGDITFINPAAKNILGFGDEEQFIGKSAHRMFHNVSTDGGLSTLEECNLQNAYKTGKQLQTWATSFNHANGKNISVECTVYPLFHEKKLEGSVVAFRDVTEKRLLLEELKWQATHDQLTKLPNRSYFEQQLIQEVSRLKRSTENSALLYIDLDRFKYINDTAGHMVGDRLLIDVGNKFRSRLREADTLARLGGDEFAVIMRNVNEKDAYAAADNFRNVLEEYEFVHAGKMYKVHASIGIAYITADTRASGEVLANADIACYIAKSRGRNTTHFFHGDSDEISTMDIELGWSARLHDALKNDKFELYYQPILSLADVDFDSLPSENGELWDNLLRNQNVSSLHYEVLLRLPDARGNRILPDVFLPTAERFNMMRDIDRWVIKNALANLAEHSVTGRSITLTINLSGQTLEDVSLSSYIGTLVESYKIDASKLVFEITETSAIANLDTADRFMNDLRELGCRFALDDFGSGFCSFSHLKYLSVDIIKIDGVFIQGMMNDGVDKAIVESIAQIARSVNKVTVAEFVENVNLLRALRDIGVDYIQGYYVSPPKEASVFPELSFDYDPTAVSESVVAEEALQVVNASDQFSEDVEHIDFDTSDVDTAGVDTINVVTTDLEPTDLETTDLDTAGLDTTDLDTSDLDTVELDTTDLDTSDLDTVELDTTDLDTSDLDTVELDTTGLDTSDLDTAELDTTGLDTSDLDTADLDSIGLDTTDRDSTDVETIEIVTTDEVTSASESDDSDIDFEAVDDQQNLSMMAVSESEDILLESIPESDVQAESDAASEQIELVEPMLEVGLTAIDNDRAVEDIIPVLEESSGLDASASNDNDKCFEAQWLQTGLPLQDVEVTDAADSVLLEDVVSSNLFSGIVESDNVDEVKNVVDFDVVEETTLMTNDDIDFQVEEISSIMAGDEDNTILEANIEDVNSDFPLDDNDTDLSEVFSLELTSDIVDSNVTEAKFGSAEKSIDANSTGKTVPPTLEIEDFVVNSDLDNFSLDLEEDDTVFQKTKTDNEPSFGLDLDDDIGEASR